MSQDGKLWSKVAKKSDLGSLGVRVCRVGCMKPEERAIVPTKSTDCLADVPISTSVTLSMASPQKMALEK